MLTQSLKLNTGRFGLSAESSARSLISTDIALSTNSTGVISQFWGLETKLQSACLSVTAARAKMGAAPISNFSCSLNPYNSTQVVLGLAQANLRAG